MSDGDSGRRMQLSASARRHVANAPLLRDSSIYLVGLAVQSLVPIIIIPLQIRGLSLTGFGSYTIAASASALLGLGASIGLPQAIVRAAGATTGDGPITWQAVPRLISLSGAIGLALGLLGVLVLVLPIDSPASSPNARFLVGAGLLAGGGAVMAATASQAFRARQRPLPFLAITLSLTVVAPLVPALLPATRTDLIAYLALWSVLALAVGTVGAATALVRERRLRVSLPSRSETSAAVRFGVPLTVAATVDAGSSLVIRLAIATIGGTALAGQFQIAAAVGLAGVAVVSAANNAWLPHLLRTDSALRFATQRRELRLLLLLGSVTAVATIVAAAPMAGYLTGAPDSTVALAIMILSVTAIMQAYCLSGQNVLFIERRSGTMSGVAMIGIALQTGIGIALAIPFGLYGPVIAIIANFVFQTVALAALTRHSYIGHAGIRSTAAAAAVWGIVLACALVLIGT